MKVYKKAIENLLAKDRIGRCDFHSHSFLSDGVLLPIEQLRRAFVKGHEGYAITDHVSASNLDIIPKLDRDCKLATKHWGFLALHGVELTHVPVGAIEEITEQAVEMGALVIVIHGETISEPVEPGTNLIASKCKLVDILAHPGLVTKEVAENCKKNDVFLEITSNKAHSITNGHVVDVGRKAKANFIQNTDTHRPSDMLNYDEGKRILLGSGLTIKEAEEVFQKNTRDFLTKIYSKI